MRNLFIAIAFIFTGTFANANANANVNSLTLSEICISNQIELNLDLGDVTDKTEAEINEVIQNFINTNLSSVDESLDCSVTVSGSVNVGIVKFEVSVTVTGTCEEIKASGSEIANNILNQVKDYIKENF